MPKPQSFIHGTLTLVITGLRVRLLGFFIRLIMV
jgi:stage V sporulation protein B